MTYEVVVIGAGPAGYHAAIRSAQLGKKTACIDKWLGDDGNQVLGGTCLNVGCIPSKALLSTSHKFQEASEKFQDLGIEVKKPKANIGVMMANKDAIVKQLGNGVGGLMKANGVSMYEGTARICSNRKIEVTSRDGATNLLQAENIIIATGSVPTSIPVCPLDQNLIVDSTGALAFQSIPARLGIIGAGAIGLELGSVWRRLGAEVVILEALADFLPALDSVTAKEAAKQFKAQGLDIRLNARVSATETSTNSVSLHYSDSEGAHVEQFDRVIVAAGRIPLTSNLLDDESGIALDSRGYISVDDDCQTTMPGVWAVGDVVRGPMLAHKGMAEGIAVAERIAGLPAIVNYDCIPGVIYTHPEIAWVGKTQEQLLASAQKFKIGSFPMNASGRAIASNETLGFISVLADENTGQILGAQMVCDQASELINQAVIAMEFDGSVEDIGLTMFAHPSLSEGFHEAALATLGHAIHIYKR